MIDQQRSRRLAVFALAVACLSLAGAVLAARGHRPSGYEVSIYRATPAAFWLGVAFAWLVAVVVAVGARDRRLRWAATTVGGGTAVVVVGLPLIRGYHFFASTDSLSHLGWIRDLGAGRTTATDLFYPALHSMAVMTSQQLGLGYPRATMVVVLVVTAGFFVAVPAAVWTLTGSDRAAVVGAFSAFMLLPINVIVTQLVAHPITQASLFVAVVVYLLVRYVTAPEGEGNGTASGGGGRFAPTALGGLLALVSLGLVLYHPQAAVAVLVVMGPMAALQLLARWRYDDGPVSGLRPVYAQTALLAVALLVWIPQHPGYADTVGKALGTFVSFASGQPTPVASEVTQRQSSLTALGSGLGEVYLKLFLVGTVYVFLAGVLFLRSLVGGVSGVADAVEGVVRVVVVGLFALGVVMVLHFLGPLTGLVYRYVAVGMTVVTVLGAVALYRFAVGPPRIDSGRSTARVAVLAVALLVMLGLSVPTMFASPFLFQPSSHVSEAQYAGYETAFAHTPADEEFLGARDDSHRYRHAIQGTVGRPWDGESLRAEAINESLASAATRDRYLVVTGRDRKREVRVYRELRYTSEDFRTIATQPGLDRVQSNGEFVLYYDRGENETSR